VLLGKYLDNTWISHDSFLPNPFQFILNFVVLIIKEVLKIPHILFVTEFFEIFINPSRPRPLPSSLSNEVT
jgi:hypothetical protein